MRPPAQEASLVEWWFKARQNNTKTLCKGLTTATLLLPLMVWKHRNSCIFEGAQPSSAGLLASIEEEAALRTKAGATGLRVVLPTTWDVH
jgi:nuclear pore complex protein Nup210